MSDYSEYDVRLAEQYRMVWKKKDAHSTVLAAWLCIAGLVLAVSAVFFRATDMDPKIQGTIGWLLFIGGGLYWIYAHETNKRAWTEVERIRGYFRQKNMAISEDGTLT